MRYYRLSLLSILAAVAPLADLVTPLPPHWDDMRVKHTWNSVPANWESLGHPPAGTTIDLHVALNPQHENALIDALHEVSDPKHPKHVLFNTPPTHDVLTCAASPLQIRRSPIQGGGRAAPRHPRAGQLLARTSWRALLFDLNDTRRQLADGHRGARVPSQQSPRCVLPAVPASRDERHRDSPDGRLWAPDNAAHTHANGGADDVLRLHAHRDAAANITQAFRWSSTGAAESGIERVRDCAFEPRSFDHAVVPTLAVQDLPPPATGRNVLGIAGYYSSIRTRQT